ncbi:uncharacterized protein [Blastocystis hominis]|uniref:Protein YIPF n=1 Tax=Blastocystis hominis TaxID=12968 RepID=D8M862_BLAHO|nr:uncharacterized protein [Blastocystis hominis]CBK24251.2 unnamed protein product [Blastocystis hominis]|eukprot:XP_012898299.1 uncharacterized protein [Blastocystis hominis]
MSNYGQAFDDDWMNVDAAPASYQPFVPTSYNTQNDFGFGYMQTPEEEDYSNEPPLLEELGIDFSHIFKKILVVLNPRKSIDNVLVNDADLKGRIQFGYTFGYFFAGCTLMYTSYILLKLLSDSSSNTISLTSVMSILGYSMIPLLFLCLFSLVLSVTNILGWVVSVLCILWSSFSASRFIELLLGSTDQRYIIMYPLVLLYAVFALITVF